MAKQHTPLIIVVATLMAATMAVLAQTWPTQSSIGPNGSVPDKWPIHDCFAAVRGPSVDGGGHGQPMRDNSTPNGCCTGSDPSELAAR